MWLCCGSFNDVSWSLLISRGDLATADAEIKVPSAEKSGPSMAFSC